MQVERGTTPESILTPTRVVRVELRWRSNLGNLNSTELKNPRRLNLTQIYIPICKSRMRAIPEFFSKDIMPFIFLLVKSPAQY